VRSMTTTVEVSAAERYGYLDLTDDLRRAIKDAGVTDGAAIAFCEHTTAALLINEWEDGAMADFRRHLTEQVPHDGVYYAHDDFDIRTQNMNEDERKNGHAFTIACSVASSPGFFASHASIAVPTPYQPGSMIRHCDHENTHGIARRSSMRVDFVRDAGRLPMLSSAISLIGVASRK